jgi:hypothetical protein
MYPKISPVRALVLGAVVATFPLPVRAVPTYTLTVSAGTAAAHVYPTMFGTNIVYNAVDVAQWPTFLSTFNALGMKALRYPGGVVTEADFDFNDSNGPANDSITLTHFLQAVAANNLTPILVVPTKRFRSNYTTTGAQYVKDFVKAVNIDHGIAGGEQFGTTQTVGLWEMGNEYYTDNSGGTPLSATTYGQIANKFGTAMKTIDASIIPVVQFQRSNLTEAQTIANQLTPGVMGSCLTHLYPGGSETFSSVESQIESGAAIFGLSPMITEWNMANDLTTGLTLGNYLPKLFQAQVDAGVTISTQWALMWSNNSVDTSLATNTGQLRPPGQVYQWLNQCASNRNSVPTSSSSSAISCLAWKDTSGHLSILVLCGASQTNATVAITINGYNGSNFVVTSDQRLYAAGGPGTETAHTPALVTNVSEAKSGNVLTITTNKNSQQEVIRIDITRL